MTPFGLPNLQQLASDVRLMKALEGPSPKLIVFHSKAAMSAAMRQIPYDPADFDPSKPLGFAPVLPMPQMIAFPLVATEPGKCHVCYDAEEARRIVGWCYAWEAEERLRYEEEHWKEWAARQFAAWVEDECDPKWRARAHVEEKPQP